MTADAAAEREELELLIGALPAGVAEALRAIGPDGLLEVVLDLGRPPAARFAGARRRWGRPR